MVSLETKWATNESLLQSYRSIFISSESFLLAVGAILFERSFEALILVSSVSMITIIFIWVPVVTARQKIVDYYKYLAEINQESTQSICSIEKYVKNKKSRLETNKILGIKSNWRLTRIKIDGILPLLFCSIWIALLFISHNSTAQ